MRDCHFKHMYWVCTRHINLNEKKFIRNIINHTSGQKPIIFWLEKPLKLKYCGVHLGCHRLRSRQKLGQVRIYSCLFSGLFFSDWWITGNNIQFFGCVSHRLIYIGYFKQQFLTQHLNLVLTAFLLKKFS